MKEVSVSANALWLKLLHELLLHGEDVSPRGIDTKELLFIDKSFDMNQPICYHQLRKLNYAFSAAEAYFIAHGDNRVENLTQYNKNMINFSDDGLIFNGAYGPPFNDQLMYVVNTLANDLLSRQAVLTIWKQNPVASYDIRCSLALQFIVRKNRIHTKVTMRSSDIWLGVPYDLFNFTIMTLRVLTLLNVKLSRKLEPIRLGIMNFSAGSSHMYMQDESKARKVLDIAADKIPAKVPERCLTDWNHVVNSLVGCMEKKEQEIKDYSYWQIRP